VKDLKGATGESILTPVVTLRNRTMSKTFAEVVEEVRRLSPAEKVEVQELLRKLLIEERSRESPGNSETRVPFNGVGRRPGSAKGEITMSDNIIEPFGHFGE
jgi:hypothetical protein